MSSSSDVATFSPTILNNTIINNTRYGFRLWQDSDAPPPDFGGGGLASPGHPELIVGLGALEASETVTITWDVLAGDGCSMTSQATLSCYQLGDLG